MAAFDDLTEREGADLARIVREARALHTEVFLPLFLTGRDSLLHAVGSDGQIDHVPSERGFWEHLAEGHYLFVRPGEIRLLPRAYAYARYADRRSLGRFLIDLRYDLAHDVTIRSKLLWMLLGVAISTGIAAWLDHL